MTTDPGTTETPCAPTDPDAGMAAAPDPAPPRTVAQILKTAGQFKPQTITIARRWDEPTEAPARVVGGILAVHKGPGGWMVTHVASGYGACQAVSSKVVAEKIARMLAGATVTDEARAAAARLLQGADA